MRLLSFFSAGLLLISAATPAQLITLKTVPVAVGDQFQITASSRLGMGGVSIAIDDHLGDPFMNPAKGSRIGESVFFLKPSLYTVTDGNGASRTLPLGSLINHGDYFGAFALAIQNMRLGTDVTLVALDKLSESDILDPPWYRLLPAQTTTNQYGALMLGRRIGTGLSVGVSGFTSRLNYVDGTGLLYFRNRALDQSGSITNLRVGFLGEFPGGHEFEAVALFNSVDVRHDVWYLDRVETGEIDENGFPVRETRGRIARNVDNSGAIGLHSGYKYRIPGGFTIGAIATGNYKLHGQIPSYHLGDSSPVRDPGKTKSYNFGLGLSKATNRFLFAVDVVAEPARSHTWVVAEDFVERPDGSFFGPGQRTTENWFTFMNSSVKLGMAYESEEFGLQLGMNVKSYDYDLYQADYVNDTWRFQRTDWLEWSWTASFFKSLPDFDFRYAAWLRTGIGRPRSTYIGPRDPCPTCLQTAPSGTDYLLAPTGPIVVDEAVIISHQVFVTVPLTRR